MSDPGPASGPFTEPVDDVLVDALGLRCPLPVIRLAQAAEGLPPGTRLVVLATDPAAAHDVPAWARMRGHTWVGAQTGADGELRLTVRLAGPDDAAAARPESSERRR